MDLTKEIATVCGSLSHPKRVEIFLALLPNIEDGVPYGALSKNLGMPPSTLSFHLRELEKGGVIERDVVGRQTIIRPSIDRLNDVLSALSQLCCPSGSPNLKKGR